MKCGARMSFARIMFVRSFVKSCHLTQHFKLSAYAHIQGQSKKIPNICDSAPMSRRRTLETVVLCSVDVKLYFDTSHITPLSMSHELRGLE